MKTQLFIPEKIKVGYQKREDTYTKRLGYVIYYDAKGVLRKEKSWKSWTTAQLGHHDHDNKPIEGFVLNKDVGGVRHSWSSWNKRLEKVRVFDPRGFEFEIDIPNLLYILQECSSVKGKGLEGEFVYAWDGTELVLLPVKSEEYIKCQKFTCIQSNKVSKSELIEGATYLTKREQTLVYLGKYTTYGNLNYDYDSALINPKKEHVFYDESTKRYEQKDSIDFISHVVDDQCHSNFATLVETLTNKPLIGKVLGFVPHPRKFQFKDGSRYYSIDYAETSGHHYKSSRNTETLKDKFGDTLYIPLSENSYQVVNIFREKEEVTPPKGQEYYFYWKLKGFGLTSSKVISFEGGEIVVKSAKNPYLGKIFTKQDIEKLDTNTLKVELRNKKLRSL